jgi:hypothetical protein
MYQGAQNMPGKLCQGSCSMLHAQNVYDMDPKHGLKCQGEKNGAKGTLQQKELQHYSCKLNAFITMGICDIRGHYHYMV